jgi:hypothetical protein
VLLGDYDFRYPLHLAAAEARVLVVSFLLSISADPNCTDRWGGTPLDDALRGGTPYHLYCAKVCVKSYVYIYVCTQTSYLCMYVFNMVSDVILGSLWLLKQNQREREREHEREPS